MPQDLWNNATPDTGIILKPGLCICIHFLRIRIQLFSQSGSGYSIFFNADPDLTQQNLKKTTPNKVFYVVEKRIAQKLKKNMELVQIYLNF